MSLRPVLLLLFSPLVACSAVDKTALDTGTTETPVDPCASPEICNGVDDDCDGLVDDQDPDQDPASVPTWYEDEDGDGFGPGRTAVEACASPYGDGVTEGGDCQADDPAVHPGAEEICNGLDDDCDGRRDLGIAEGVLVYQDTDRDGYGVDETATLGCADLDGYATVGGDCDDDDRYTFAGAPEFCFDGQDQDCGDDADGGCPVEVCGDLREDTVWENNGVGYYVSCEIDVSARLTIEPGVTVYFAPLTGLEVGEFGVGTLNIDAAEDPVIFTSASWLEDPYTTPEPGAWRGVLLGPGADGSALRGLEIHYAGSPGEDEADRPYGALTTTEASVTLEDSLILGSAVNGIEALGGGALTLQRVTLRENQGDGLRLAQESAAPTVRNSTFSANGGYAMIMLPTQTAQLDTSNTFEEVDGDEELIALVGEEIAHDLEIPDAGVSYFATGTIVVAGPEAPVLTLQDGVEMMFELGFGLQIGSVDEPGDLIVDGATKGVTLWSPGWEGWEGLETVYMGGQTEVTGLTLIDGGMTAKGELTLQHQGDPVEVVIRDSTIMTSRNFGLYVGCGVTVAVSGSSFLDNALAGVYFACSADDERGAGITSFQDNVMSGNALPIEVPASSVPQLDTSSSFVGNTDDWVVIADHELTSSGTWVALDAPYRVGEQGLLIAGSDAPTLTLAAGTTVGFSHFGLAIGSKTAAGALVVEGTEDAPVVLTSASSSPAAGDWAGLSFDSACEDSSLSGLQIHYAQSGLTLDCAASLTVSDLEILDASGADLVCLVDDDAVTWTNVSYETNEGCSID